MKKERDFSKKVPPKEREQRAKDAAYLKRSDRQRIAEVTGYTHASVTYFILGYSDNELIKKVFNEFVHARKSEIEQDLKAALNQ